MCECVLECLLQPGSPPPSPESANRAVFTSAARWHLDHYWQRNLHGALKTAESAEHSHTHTHRARRGTRNLYTCVNARKCFSLQDVAGEKHSVRYKIYSRPGLTAKTGRDN